MTAKFLPKKAVAWDGALLQELQGDVSEAIARDVIALLPPITSSSHVHDNGCGYGAVTCEIMATNPPSGFQITATDKNQMYLDQLQSTLDKNPSWPPVKIEIMNANSLPAPDDVFTHSITDFVLRGLDDEVAAARHIWRTVKPGGTAAVAVWKDMPWQTSFINAHRHTRGANAPLPPFLSMVEFTNDELASKLDQAGWKNYKVVEKSAWLKTNDIVRWSTIGWTFLSNPVGGWTQADEDSWDEAISFMVEDLKKGDAYVEEDGVHKIRMTALVAIGQK